jgi:hypothetical protein
MHDFFKLYKNEKSSLLYAFVLYNLTLLKRIFKFKHKPSEYRFPELNPYFHKTTLFCT